MGKKTYIGDGVYASFDGYQIWLYTERENGVHEIALEPEVFDALCTFAEEINNQIRERKDIKNDVDL